MFNVNSVNRVNDHVGEHEFVLKFKIQVLKYFKWLSELFKNLSPLLHIHRDKSCL